MEWYIQTISWYIILSILGFAFFPITKKLFSSFYDYGYPFAKAIGLVLASYTIFILATFTPIPFNQITVWAIVIIFAIFNYKLFHSLDFKNSGRWKLIVLEEVIFFIAFMTWAFIRSQEPAIRGLEKFMDFGFINAVIREETFPAQDMWLAGGTINYYYFGHVTGAFLTRLSHLPSYITYNLILATIFALGITETFSLGLNAAYHGLKKNVKLSVIAGMLSSFIVNFGGNLHTIYAFTTGYTGEEPSPFWQLTAKYKLADLTQLSTFIEKLPDFYWYPNATRFIPLTIHEFPLYSYVVADLHGHVFDIPFVLLTIAILFVLFASMKHKKQTIKGKTKKFVQKLQIIRPLAKRIFTHPQVYVLVTIIGFLTAIHYMTNAFDAPIYLLLTLILLFANYQISRDFFILAGLLIASFLVFSLPFTLYFEPFATGIGVNCAPDFLIQYGNIGPFIFEEGNCQISPWWMLLTLWGFFWFNFIFFALKIIPEYKKITRIDYFILLLFAFSTLLVTIPEVVYAKDIYPSHFRANTMFKLGYQGFIMMGIASAFTFVSFKSIITKRPFVSILYLVLFIPLFALIAIYPNFAINSFYGNKQGAPSLDGTAWVDSNYPAYSEIIDYLNWYVKGQPIILEAQGDSYTDYNIVSAYTGLPTVAGWWVHEWLWRGDSSVVGNLIPDIQTIYESEDIQQTKSLLEKHNIAYVIIGPHEREKYQNLQEEKFEALGQAVFESGENQGKIIKITLDREINF